jgi:hypothetical protein
VEPVGGGGGHNNHQGGGGESEMKGWSIQPISEAQCELPVCLPLIRQGSVE